MHRLKSQKKTSIHAQVRRRHNTKFTRHITSHHKKFPTTSCGAILPCNYMHIRSKKYYECLCAVFPNQPEKVASFLPESMLRHLLCRIFISSPTERLSVTTNLTRYVRFTPSTNLSEKFLIPVRNQQDIITSVPSSSYKVADIFVQFLPYLNFLGRF